MRCLIAAVVKEMNGDLLEEGQDKSTRMNTSACGRRACITCERERCPRAVTCVTFYCPSLGSTPQNLQLLSDTSSSFEWVVVDLHVNAVLLSNAIAMIQTSLPA
jgi:hypothetical protein